LFSKTITVTEEINNFLVSFCPSLSWRAGAHTRLRQPSCGFSAPFWCRL